MWAGGEWSWPHAALTSIICLYFGVLCRLSEHGQPPLLTLYPPPPLSISLCATATSRAGRIPAAAGSRGLQLSVPAPAPGADGRIPAPASPGTRGRFVFLRLPTPRTGGAFAIVGLPAAGAGGPVLLAPRAHSAGRSNRAASARDSGGHSAAAAAVATRVPALHGAAPDFQLVPAR